MSAVQQGEDSWQHLQRTRCAVLMLDVVESVRIMEADEASAIRRWRRIVEHVREVLLPHYNGRLVKSLGDGLLLRFAEPVQARDAAFAIHAAVERLEGTAEPDLALRLRMAIHLCDVVEDDFDIYGTGVNLVARLATLGTAGDTVVSAEMRDALIDGEGCHLVDMGDCFFKHLARPVRAFRVLAPGASPVNRFSLAPPRDERPAIAVLPFAPVAGEPSAAALGDALAEGVNAALSATHALRVISILSTHALGTSPTPARVHDVLGAAYLLTGQYRLRDSRLGLHAQLRVARDGRLLWEEAIDVDSLSVLSADDDTFRRIATAIGAEILRVEVLRARALPFANLESYSLYIAGMFMLHRLSRSDFELARSLLEHLCQRHPRSAAPRAMLAKWHLLSAVQGWVSDRALAARQSRASSLRALDLEPDNALALSMSAIVVAQIDGDLALARSLGEAAVAANPQESHAWLNLGGIHSYLGNGALAESMPLQAISLSPVDPARFAFNAFLAEGRLVAGKLAEAASAARDAIRLNAIHATPHRILTIALAMAGHADEAQSAAQDLLRVDPGFRVDHYAQRYPGRGQPLFAERLRALREAGVPA